MKLRVIKQYSPVEFLIKEEIGSFINERPNQAIKFLKQKNLNPETEEKGKEILDNIINITIKTPPWKCVACLPTHHDENIFFS